MVILLENECSFSGADNVRWWGLKHNTRWLKMLNIMPLKAVGTKSVCNFP